MKYTLQVGQSSRGNRMNYSFNELFNTLMNWKVMNFIILGLNYYSTEDGMKKAYRSLACRFQAEKNQHSQFSDDKQG